MKSKILNRTNEFMTNCQVFTEGKINSYITAFLDPLQYSNAKDVAQALNSYLDDVYTQKYNFLVYVAQNFDSRSTFVLDYWGGGLRGKIANGVWTVFWAATPVWPKNDVLQLKVDNGKILNTLTTSPVTTIYPREAYSMLRKCFS